MALGVKNTPPTAKQKRRSTKPPSAHAPPHEMVAWKATLLIFLAFCVTGLIPAGIVAHASGKLQLGLPSGIALFTGNKQPSPTDAPDLALPRDVWVARSVDVLPEPGRGAALATLAPAFPVKLLQHERIGAAVWSRVEWGGPVIGTGGTGWVPDAALTSVGHTDAILGDLGALAPSLRQAVSPHAQQFAAIVYIPSQNRLYIAGKPDSPFALGTGYRPMLLSALYGGAEASNQPVSLNDALTLSHGDTTATPAIYQRIGGADGLSQYLSSHSISDIQTSPTWTACHATPRAVTGFYTQLAGNLLQDKDRASVVSILSLADAPTTTNLVAPWARSAGNLLVAGIAPTDNTFTVSIAGILNPPHGPQLIVVAVTTSQPSTDAAFQAMQAFYAQLTALFAG